MEKRKIIMSRSLTDYAVPTRTNTKFTPWWAQLNAVLTRRNAAEALFGDARDYYEMGFDPETAAQDIIVTRED